MMGITTWKFGADRHAWNQVSAGEGPDVLVDRDDLRTALASAVVVDGAA